MIVYPNGDILYWLEGYPNDLGEEKNKKEIVLGEDIANIHTIYCDTTSVDVIESNIEIVMQMLGTGYKKKEM